MMKKLFTLTLSLLLAYFSPCAFGSQFPLHDAAKAGDVKQVQELLERIDVNAKDNDGNTPLHVAAYNNTVCVVDVLLANLLCNLNEKNKNNLTPLHCALMKAHREIALRLVSTLRCNTLEMDPIGRIPLHLVAAFGQTKIAKLLLKTLPYNGVNKQELAFGKTPLHFAAQNGQYAVVMMLLAHPSCNLNIKDKTKKIPLDYAIINGHNEIVYLIRYWDDFIKGLALTYRKSILLCNLPRCGAHTAPTLKELFLNNLIRQEILSYLRPDTCTYSHQEVMRYVTVAQQQAPTLTPTAPAQAPTATTQTAPATATAQATATATATATSQQSTVQTVLNYCSIQ